MVQAVNVVLRWSKTELGCTAGGGAACVVRRFIGERGPTERLDVLAWNCFNTCFISVGVGAGRGCGAGVWLQAV